MAYDKVSIANSTLFAATGRVEYASAFCSNDSYSVDSMHTWSASSRGVCLLTKITATVKTPYGDIAATSYGSAGTTYSRFAIVATGEKQFAVTRLVSSMDGDEIPEDYVEPTTQQK